MLDLPNALMLVFSIVATNFVCDLVFWLRSSSYRTPHGVPHRLHTILKSLFVAYVKAKTTHIMLLDVILVCVCVYN